MYFNYLLKLFAIWKNYLEIHNYLQPLMTVNHTIGQTGRTFQDRDKKHIKAVTYKSHSNYADHLISLSHCHSKLENDKFYSFETSLKCFLKKLSNRKKDLILIFNEKYNFNVYLNGP